MLEMIKCDYCGLNFKKEKKEINKCKKRKWLQFCSKQCSKQGKRNHGGSSPESIKRLNNWWTSKDGLIWKQKSPYRHYLRLIKNRIKNNNHKKKYSSKCNITLEYLQLLWQNQNGICPYSGIKLEHPQHGKAATIKTASVDRINSSKGYIQGNVQFVSIQANFAKNKFTHDEMLEFCQQIANFWRSQESNLSL